MFLSMSETENSSWKYPVWDVPTANPNMPLGVESFDVKH